MVYLGRNENRICSLREISQKEKISFDYLEKILSSLEKKGLVESKRGAKGGYRLARSSKKIKLGEIMQGVEKKIILVECVGEKACPRKKTCSAITAWKKIQEAIEQTIDSITLYEIIKK